MPSTKLDVSALLYRFRGTILGVIAVALAVAPPSLFPEKFYINNCVAGILIALPLYVFSALLRVQTRRFIGEHTRGKVHAAESLVTCDPYSRVRHPLYISNTGFALGIAFFHLGGSFWIVPFVFVVVAFEVALSRIEDCFLERKFGDAWRAWASKTPAVFPQSRCINAKRKSQYTERVAFQCREQQVRLERYLTALNSHITYVPLNASEYPTDELILLLQEQDPATTGVLFGSWLMHRGYTQTVSSRQNVTHVIEAIMPVFTLFGGDFEKHRLIAGYDS